MDTMNVGGKTGCRCFKLDNTTLPSVIISHKHLGYHLGVSGLIITSCSGTIQYIHFSETSLSPLIILVICTLHSS